jgi:serine/threonine protein kinase
MAPEIVFQDTYDSKVDVFSFGIVLTELIYNRPPQKRSIQDKYAFDANKFTAGLPEDCPKEFASIVLECTKLRPEDRPGFKGTQLLPLLFLWLIQSFVEEICTMMRNLEKSL